MSSVNFTVINDLRVLAIPIKECNEPLVDLLGKSWITVRPSQNTTYAFSKVRKGVVERLEKSAQKLPNGFRLELEDGHRPIAMQRQYFQAHYEKVKAEHPDWDDNRLRQETSLFVAPPEDVPPHTTGGAVDILLLDSENRIIDLGGYGTPNEGYGDLAFSDSKNISPEQQRLRAILVSVLSSAGLVNYPAEWWHWSYGDKYWAYITGHPFALYGTVDAEI